jgi:multisubunit Na+/H+ antiporter MnhB subunit
MPRILKLIGGLSVGIGLIWVLQGLNILPGSFMTGDRQWAINGAIAVAVGAVLLVLANRKPPSKPNA